MKLRIEPYKTWSGGARALGQRLGVLRATNKQVAKHGDFDVIINWGRSERRFNGKYINPPDRTSAASDKLLAFQRFQEEGVPTLTFTSDRAVAQEWLDNGDHIVVRKMLRGSAGRGIVLVGPEGSEIATVHTLPAAPLYTKYAKKATEYRIHVAFGKVIDVQQKKRNTSVPDDAVDWQIRNHHKGWIFARSDVNAPAIVLEGSIAAVGALGLDFGAVDVGYNEKKGEAFVFEVNTAPGLVGTTLEAYYTAFIEKFPQLSGGMYAKRRVACQ